MNCPLCGLLAECTGISTEPLGNIYTCSCGNEWVLPSGQEWELLCLPVLKSQGDMFREAHRELAERGVVNGDVGGKVMMFEQSVTSFMAGL